MGVLFCLHGHFRFFLTVAIAGLFTGPATGQQKPRMILQMKSNATSGVYINSTTSVVFSPDGKRLASGRFDGSIKLWDPVTGKNTATFTGHANCVFSVAFSPDGKTLASGSFDKSIKLWDVASGKNIATLKGHDASITSVAFSPNGKTLASSGCIAISEKDRNSGKPLKDTDRSLKLWDVASGKNISTFKGHKGYVYSVSFSPNGKTLASGSGDKSINLWDIATGKNTATLKGHDAFITCVAFSPDGKTLVSASYEDKTIKLWDVATGGAIVETCVLGGEEKVAYPADVYHHLSGPTRAPGVRHESVY